MPKDTKDTYLDLDALERLLAEATPGRWSHRSKLEDGTPCCDVIGDSDDDWSIVATGNPDLFDMRDADARLIAAAVNALPELIAAARERDGLRARMESNENAWNAEQGELLDLVADRTIDLAGAKTAARFIAAERDALRAEVERTRAVVEAAREFRTVCDDWVDTTGWESGDKLDAALAALDGKGSR